MITKKSMLINRINTLTRELDMLREEVENLKFLELEKDLYTTAEVGHILNISAKTVSNYCSKGIIGSIKDGHIRRIPAQALHSYQEALKKSVK
jgi:excisionase family DNA binding protein